MNMPKPDSTAAGSSARRPWVLKIGGRLIEDPQVRGRFCAACAQLHRPFVLVHGGGCKVTALQDRLGVAVTFHQGRRVTSPAAMDVVEMVLSGAINKTLVRGLISAGCLAQGLSGCDAALIRCRRVADLGEVGEPDRIDPKGLIRLLDEGVTPVLSPVSLGPNDEPLNVNADEVACAIAAALDAERLLLLSDVPGVQVGGNVRSTLDVDEVEALIRCGEVHGGMVPKLRAAASALHDGVGEAIIAGFFDQPLTNNLGGTRVRVANR